MFEIFTVSSLSRKADERGGFSLASGKNPYKGNCDIRNMDGIVGIRKTLESFHINARKQFNNNLTFDYTGYSSKIVQVLLDGLHLEIPGLPTAVKNLPDMLELILFLLDDGKIR